MNTMHIRRNVEDLSKDKIDLYLEKREIEIILNALEYDLFTTFEELTNKQYNSDDIFLLKDNELKFILKNKSIRKKLYNYGYYKEQEIYLKLKKKYDEKYN